MKKIAKESAIKKMIMPFVNQPAIQKEYAYPFVYATQLYGNNITETESGNLTFTFYNVRGFGNDGYCEMYGYVNPTTLKYKVFQHENICDGKTPLVEVVGRDDFEKAKLSAMVGVTLWNAFYGDYKSLYPVCSKEFQQEVFGEVEKDIVDL